MHILFIKILFLILIFFIALFLIIFSESVYISVALKNNNLSYLGILSIKYYFLQISLNLKTRQANILINTKYLTKKILTFKTSNSNDEHLHEKHEQTDAKEESQTNNDDKIRRFKELLKLINNAKKDILEVITLILGLISFKNSYVLMNLGLNDNNLTIKVCNKIWAITAPFYAIGLQVILTPEINKTILKTETNINFEIKLLKILKLLMKILLNSNLRQIILFIIKHSD